MQLALIGLPGSGVKTTFAAITGLTEAAGAFGQGAAGRVTALKVPDPRLEAVSRVFQPKKTVSATVEILEFPGLFGGGKTDSRLLGKVREAEALVPVLRAFESLALPHPEGGVDPRRDYRALASEMLLADLGVVEGRLARLASSLQKRKDEDEAAERDVLLRCKECLDRGERLSTLTLDPFELKRIRGFGFLTLKRQLVLVNIGDAQLGSEAELTAPFEQQGLEVRALSASLEEELAGMEEAERDEFMRELGIPELAAPIVLSAAYRALRVVTFYTYSEDECRAWTLRRGETALDAAAKVHTDLARGFIRAEVVSFDDFQEHGDIKSVKAAGRFRLEGKDYVVADGDLIIIRHSG